MDRNKNSQTAFEALVNQDPSKVSHSNLKAVTLAVWHENFTPEISVINSINSARSACYLLDRLMRYNCVTRQRQSELISVINKLEKKFGIKPVLDNELDKPTGSSVCKIAKKWGLKSDLKLMLRDMLQYQTRHYKHYSE